MSDKRRISMGKASPLGSSITRVREHIRKSALTEGARLPPERVLAEQLGLSRGGLRQALDVLDASGEIWRHVGQGTFVGRCEPQTHDELANQVARRSNPVEVIEARLILEPRLAALAALRGTEEDFSAMARQIEKGEQSKSTIECQRCGDEFHHQVAKASKNGLLQTLFESVFRVRALTSWGRLRANIATPENLKVLYKEHMAILQAIRCWLLPERLSCLISGTALIRPFDMEVTSSRSSL